MEKIIVNRGEDMTTILKVISYFMFENKLSFINQFLSEYVINCVGVYDNDSIINHDTIDILNDFNAYPEKYHDFIELDVDINFGREEFCDEICKCINKIISCISSDTNLITLLNYNKINTNSGQIAQELNGIIGKLLSINMFDSRIDIMINILSTKLETRCKVKPSLIGADDTKNVTINSYNINQTMLSIIDDSITLIHEFNNEFSESIDTKILNEISVDLIKNIHNKKSEKLDNSTIGLIINTSGLIDLFRSKISDNLIDVEKMDDDLNTLFHQHNEYFTSLFNSIARYVPFSGSLFDDINDIENSEIESLQRIIERCYCVVGLKNNNAFEDVYSFSFTSDEVDFYRTIFIKYYNYIVDKNKQLKS